MIQPVLQSDLVRPLEMTPSSIPSLVCVCVCFCYLAHMFLDGHPILDSNGCPNRTLPSSKKKKKKKLFILCPLGNINGLVPKPISPLPLSDSM